MTIFNCKFSLVAQQMYDMFFQRRCCIYGEMTNYFCQTFVVETEQKEENEIFDEQLGRQVKS